MKFLHVGDLHLGKSVNEVSMIVDQRYILEQIIAMAAQEKADAVLIAGDVYDRRIPGEEAVALLDYFLTELSERIADLMARRSLEDKIEKKIAEKLEENHQDYVKDIRMQVLEEERPQDESPQAKLRRVM